MPERGPSGEAGDLRHAFAFYAIAVGLAVSVALSSPMLGESTSAGSITSLPRNKAAEHSSDARRALVLDENG